MAGMTPVFGFPYPTIGDTVSATDFQALSSAIDAELTLLKAQETALRVKTSCSATVTNGAFSFGAAEVNYVNNEWVNPPGFHSTVSNQENFNILSNGIYFVTTTMQMSATTLTEFQISIVRNGFTMTQGGSEPTPNIPQSCSGVFACTVGQTISVQITCTGTGTPTVSGRVQVFQISAF